jgi:hypothetical protein
LSEPRSPEPCKKISNRLDDISSFSWAPASLTGTKSLKGSCFNASELSGLISGLTTLMGDSEGFVCAHSPLSDKPIKMTLKKRNLRIISWFTLRDKL